MRILLVLLLAAMSPAAAAAQTKLSATPLADSMLVLLLNDGQEVAISNLTDSPYLIPRLYSISHEGGCVEDTHMVCTHRYFLAVAEEGVAGDQAVFDLGEVGEITRARVLADRGRNPRLRVVVLNYPPDIFQYQRDLVRQERVYLIHLALDSLRITPEP
ncbi:hypothetical protein [Longimicrobium sp.]|uniref:hypothetical protein n=1 Tax=Longimicrobium sp. TaxID=2029185 RepID=UPI003B3B7D59